MPRRHVVHLDAEALAEMVTEALAKYPLETGGVLLGSTTDDGAAVIHRVIGPGPEAQHRRSSFEPDDAWQQHQLDAVFEREPKINTYLGDWHTHPDGRARPSPTDVRAAQVIADAPDALQPKPLTLIVGITGQGAMSPACFRLTNGKLAATGLIVRPSRLP